MLTTCYKFSLYIGTVAIHLEVTKKKKINNDLKFGQIGEILRQIYKVLNHHTS